MTEKTTARTGSTTHPAGEEAKTKTAWRGKELNTEKNRHETA